MRTLLIVRPHSIIDLITNSSSELFVYSGVKSLDLVKEFLVKLIESYNTLNESQIKINKNDIFNNIFGELSISNYNFAYYSFPSKLKNEYEKYHNMRTISGSWDDYERGFEDSKRYEELKKIEEESRKESGYQNFDYKTQNEEYIKRWKLFLDKREKIWAEWEKDKNLSEIALFRYFLDNNGFTKEYNQLNKILLDKENIIKHGINIPYNYEEYETLRGLYDEFITNLYYRTEIKRGDILIYSAGSNTIPYELVNSIESYLNARHYHLG